MHSSVPVNNNPTHSTTNSLELDLNSKHNITAPQTCSDKDSRPIQRSAHVGPTNSSPHSPIIPQLSRQLPTEHVESGGRAQKDSSMLPSTCPKETIPEHASKDQGERLPSIHTITVSAALLLAATRTQEPYPTPEPVSKRAKSKPACQPPVQLPVDGNDRRVSATSVDNSDLQGLPQSCRQNKRFTLDGPSAAERSHR